MHKFISIYQNLLSIIGITKFSGYHDYQKRMKSDGMLFSNTIMTKNKKLAVTVAVAKYRIN